MPDDRRGDAAEYGHEFSPGAPQPLAWAHHNDLAGVQVIGQLIAWAGVLLGVGAMAGIALGIAWALWYLRER